MAKFFMGEREYGRNKESSAKKRAPIRPVEMPDFLEEVKKAEESGDMGEFLKNLHGKEGQSGLEEGFDRDFDEETKRVVESFGNRKERLKKALDAFNLDGDCRPKGQGAQKFSREYYKNRLSLGGPFVIFKVLLTLLCIGGLAAYLSYLYR